MTERPSVRMRLRRGTQSDPSVREYEIPDVSGQSVLGALLYIQQEVDPTITFSCSCRIGLCASCLVRVDGKVVRSCATLVRDNILVEPYKDEAERDLVAMLPPLFR